MDQKTLSLEKLEVRSLLGGGSGFEVDHEANLQSSLEAVEEISAFDQAAQMIALTVLLGAASWLIFGDCYVRTYGFPADHFSFNDV